jgi:hypothetical protein
MAPVQVMASVLVPVPVVQDLGQSTYPLSGLIALPHP